MPLEKNTRLVVVFLFFPVIILLFGIGWFFYVIGDNQTRNRKMIQENKIDFNLETVSTENESDFEIGVMEEFAEEYFAD